MRADAQSGIVRPRPLELTREQVRQRLSIPSRHFLERGFSREVLDAFDVGESRKLERTVVPLYGDADQVCIGYTVRSYKPPCGACKKHHDPGVPCKWGQSKWGIMKGFPRRSYLYNYRAARTSDAPYIFLVEGPPDVWRLAEAGHVGVALLGVDATDEQLAKLATIGKQIRVAFDNDRAGQDGRARFWRKMEVVRSSFSAVDFAVPHPFKDFGDVPVDELHRALLRPA